jgi:S-formylglutathione hydrolase FrmB
LHGYAGDYSNWIVKAPRLQYFADELQVIIVCPDGHPSSWYFDSPMDASMRYETFISNEVPSFIDANYKTFQNRHARAISGLSMGGHGALFIAFRHADVFGACGSISGAVDLASVKNKFELSQRIGDTVKFTANWKNYSVLNIIEKKPSQPLAVMIDCGWDDYFFASHKKLHEKMLRLRIAQDYVERPGKHEWPYWVNAIEYQLLFFSKYFSRYVK